MQQGFTRFRWFPRLWSVGLAGLGFLVAGCHHPELSEMPEPMRATMFAPRPPLFLTAPVGSLLTNVPGFSAHVVLKKENDPFTSASGQLLGAGGRLLFAPEKDEPLGKHAPAPGFSFIWDTAENRGWLLSEALQGYAPISSSLSTTSMAAKVSVNPRQMVGNHPCRVEMDTFRLSNGSTSVLEVLRATDLGDFPLQISSKGESALVTISLSKVLLKAPAPELFKPPEGFTKYNSAEAMVDELAARQRALRRRSY